MPGAAAASAPWCGRRPGRGVTSGRVSRHLRRHQPRPGGPSPSRGGAAAGMGRPVRRRPPGQDESDAWHGAVLLDASTPPGRRRHGVAGGSCGAPGAPLAGDHSSRIPAGRVHRRRPWPRRHGCLCPGPPAWQEMSRRRADVIIRPLLVAAPDLPLPEATVGGEADGRLIVVVPSQADSAAVGAWARQRHAAVVATITDAVEAAVERLGGGRPRRGGERDIPLISGAPAGATTGGVSCSASA
jgi:hypothetical protein